MGISVVLLAVNEAENLKILFPKILSMLDKMETSYEVLLIDSAKATDDTASICAQFPKVRYINQEESRYAGAFRTGIKYAQEDHLLVLDADGSHDPEMIPQIYAKSMEGYDLVIGSRYCKGGKTDDAVFSFLMSKVLNLIMRIVIGVRAKDISTSYRIYQTEQIKAVCLTCENYEVLQEVILRMKKNKKNFRIAEVPITFEKRLFGESKRKLMRFILTYFKTLFRFVKIRISTSV